MALLFCWLPVACAGPLPDIAPMDGARAALGIDDVLELRVESEPLDAAAVDADTEPLTLAAALRRAVLHAPELQVALAEVAQATAAAERERLWSNPLFSFVIRMGVGQPQLEAGLAEPFVDVLRTPARARAADARLRAAAAGVLLTALDVAVELQQGHAEAWAADRALPELEAQGEVLARLLEVAESRVRLGEATIAEATAIEAQKLELGVEIERARLRQRTARLRLAGRIGQPSSAADWRLPDVLDEVAVPAVAAERALCERALRFRPEVQACGWELAALGEDAGLAGWVFADATAGVEAQHAPDWQVGPNFGIPVPLFNDGSAARREAGAAVVAARHRLTAAARTVVAEVRAAAAALATAARVRDDVVNGLVPLQQSRLDRAEAAWRAGQLDVSAVLLAQSDWRAVRLRAIELERELRVAHFRLLRAAGGVAAADTAAPLPAESELPPAEVRR